MKELTMNASTLNTLVSHVAVIKAGNLPAHEFTKLTVTDKLITVENSNSDVDIRFALPVTDDVRVDTVGTILIPTAKMKTLTRVLKKDEALKFVVNDSETEIKLSFAKTKMTIPTIHVSAYPDVPKVEGGAVSMSHDQFAKVTGYTSYAVSKESSQPVLTGVHLVAKNGRVMAVSTDRRRLAKYEFESDTEDFDVVIPASTLQLMHQSLREAETIRFVTNGSQIVMSGKGVGIGIEARVLEGNYPDAARLIPNNHTASLTIGREYLLETLRLATIAGDKVNVVKIAYDNGVLSLEAYDQGSASLSSSKLVMQQELDGQWQPDEDKYMIAFNPQYLGEALGTFSGDKVVLNFKTSLEPFTIDDGMPETQIALVTPIRL